MDNRRTIFLAAWLGIAIVFGVLSCAQEEVVNTVENASDFRQVTQNTSFVKGKPNYLTSPFVTAGDRVYMVGHQDGTFPDLGWHIKGEMGGIWNHPIKLMDGFSFELIKEDGSILALESAQAFVNYPFANKQVYQLESSELEVERWQFVPDHKEGLVVQLVIKNRGEEDQNIRLRWTTSPDLRPTWLGERTQMEDGPDYGNFAKDLDAWLVKDSLNNWFTMWGSDLAANGHASDSVGPDGIDTALYHLDYQLSLPGKGEVIANLVIAGSYHSKEAAVTTYQDIKQHFPEYLKQKSKRYQDLASSSKLTIPDKDLQRTFEWLKYNSDWLVRKVPEVGSGIMAGIPDYPWWFGCDSEYALRGYMMIGQFEAVLNTISLLDSISNEANGNGRIVHEVSTNGVVFNPGNINETPQYATLIWEVFKWLGDPGFLEKYYPTVEEGLSWLLEENDADDNLFPEGFGMMEIHGLDSEMIDVASYTQKGFSDAAKMAAVLGKEEQKKEYEQKASELKERINQIFWSEEFKSYADFLGTNTQALHLIGDAIQRAEKLDKPWAVAELKQTQAQLLARTSNQSHPFVLHHNWVVNTPMEVGLADPDKAVKALTTAEKFVNPFGMFVTGIDRDESAGKDEGSFEGTKVFSYVGAVMTLPTGVQAVAENNYGRPNKALDYLKRMTRSFSYALPGSMYEVSPDYGMMTQAWNTYAFAVPIVHQFFGIDPSAWKKEIRIQPQMPEEWDKVSLENVKVADNEISVYYTKTAEELILRVEQKLPDWNLKISLPKQENAKFQVNGEGVVKETADQFIFSGRDPVLSLKIFSPSKGS